MADRVFNLSNGTKLAYATHADGSQTLCRINTENIIDRIYTKRVSGQDIIRRATDGKGKILFQSLMPKKLTAGAKFVISDFGANGFGGACLSGSIGKNLKPVLDPSSFHVTTEGLANLTRKILKYLIK